MTLRFKVSADGTRKYEEGKFVPSDSRTIVPDWKVFRASLPVKAKGGK